VTHWSRRAVGACLLTVALVPLGCTKNDSPSTVIPGTTTGAGMAIEFRSESDPLTSGDNAFEVTVIKDGARVTDATVTAAFSMPAMPSMNMPEMHSDATLQHQGDGRYRGTGHLSMGGTWNVTVKVSRGAEELGRHRLNLVAK